MVKKAKPPLLISMAIVSMSGFLALILNQFGFFNFNEIITELGFVILGIGLMFEGDIVKMYNAIFGKGTIKQNISNKIVTLVTGITSAVAGLLSLIGFANNFLESFKVFISVIAIIVIIWETFYKK